MRFLISHWRVGSGRERKAAREGSPGSESKEGEGRQGSEKHERVGLGEQA